MKNREGFINKKELKRTIKLMKENKATDGKSGPHCCGLGGSTQFAQRLESAVTAPPLVGCVVWRVV